MVFPVLCKFLRNITTDIDARYSVGLDCDPIMYTLGLMMGTRERYRVVVVVVLGSRRLPEGGCNRRARGRVFPPKNPRLAVDRPLSLSSLLRSSHLCLLVTSLSHAHNLL